MTLCQGLHVMFRVDRSYLLVVTGCDDTEDPDLETGLSSCKLHAFLVYIYTPEDTWNLRIHPWKRIVIFQTIIFRFYVNLRGCIRSGMMPFPLGFATTGPASRAFKIQVFWAPLMRLTRRHRFWKCPAGCFFGLIKAK